MNLMLNRPHKQSKSNILIGRLRRSLIVGLIGMLLLVLCLFYCKNSNQNHFLPSVLPRGGTPDMFVRSTTGPRVVIFVMSDKIDDALCYSVGSAYLSGLPVVVAGYDMPFRGFLSKFDFMERSIKNAGLNPEDVVIVIDSDTVFTGVDINPFLDQFIAQSAARPEELDVLAVRQGRAMAPFLVGAEGGCWAPSVLEDGPACHAGFNAVYEKVQTYIAAHPEHNLAFPFDLSPQRNLNSGVVVSRRWAYKEFFQKAVNLVKKQPTKYNSEKGWNCAQSVYAALYLDVIAWEVEKDVFSMPLKERQTVRSPYGMRAGFIGLDFANVFSSHLAVERDSAFELHDERWARYLPVDGSKHPHAHSTTDLKSMSRFVEDLYRRAYAAHGEGIFTKNPVSMFVNARRVKNEVTYITSTAPLLALELRPVDTVDNMTRRTFPVVIHTKNFKSNFSNLKLMEHVSVGLGWFTPMVHNRHVHFHAMEHLSSLPLFLLTRSYILRDSYFAKCRLPFETSIQKVEVL